MSASLLQHLGLLALDIVRLCLWLAFLLIVFVPLERAWALHPRRHFRKSFGTDLVYYFLSGLVPKLLLILPLTVLAATLHHLVGATFYQRVAELPLVFRVAAALVVGEIGSYWGHRWSHESPFLWCFHAIHHSAEEMDWLVNSRAHPIDMVFVRLCGLVPMYALGLAQPMADRLDLVPVLVTIAGTIRGFFIHSNVSWRLGRFERMLSTPAFHPWHHTNDGPEHVNKNYAAMLPWVDRCFGTYYLPKQEWPTRYGTDTPPPPDLAHQLFKP